MGTWERSLPFSARSASYSCLTRWAKPPAELQAHEQQPPVRAAELPELRAVEALGGDEVLRESVVDHR
jgi:hypothetical protein